MNRSFCSNNSHFSILSCSRRCYSSRFYNTDNRNLYFFFYLFQSIRTGSITRNNNCLYILSFQKTHNLSGIFGDCFLRFASIRYSRSITKIHNSFIWNLTHNFSCYSQTTNSGIKNTNRQILQIRYFHRTCLLHILLFHLFSFFHRRILTTFLFPHIVL